MAESALLRLQPKTPCVLRHDGLSRREHGWDISEQVAIGYNCGGENISAGYVALARS